MQGMPEEAADTRRVQIAAQCRSSINYITVEPAVFCTMFVVNSYNILTKQYIYQRIASDHGLDVHTKRAEVSCSTITGNQSDPNYMLDRSISAETASWTLYLSIGIFVPELLSDVLLGSWGDKVGRKPPILVSLFGMIVLPSCFLVVATFELSLYFLFVGHILTGLLGDFCNLLGCSFSYLSDVTTPATRTLRMAVLEMIVGMGGFVASITSGLWDLSKGYQNPFWCMFGLAVFGFVYTLFLLPPNTDERIEHSFSQLFSVRPFVHMYQVLKPNANNRHIALLLFTLCFCILMTTSTGLIGLLVVYEQGTPFCFNSLLIGLMSGLGQMSFFVTLVVLKIFSGFSTQPKLVTVGVLLTISSLVLFAFSKTIWMLFLAQALQLLFDLPSPILRSQTSRVVTPNEVGAIFAVLACATAIGEILGAVLFQGIYAATAGTALHGAAFLVASVLLVAMLPIYWTGYRSSGLRTSLSAARYSTLSEEE